MPWLEDIPIRVLVSASGGLPQGSHCLYGSVLVYPPCTVKGAAAIWTPSSHRTQVGVIYHLWHVSSLLGPPGEETSRLLVYLNGQ